MPKTSPSDGRKKDETRPCKQHYKSASRWTDVLKQGSWTTTVAQPSWNKDKNEPRRKVNAATKPQAQKSRNVAYGTLYRQEKAAVDGQKAVAQPNLLDTNKNAARRQWSRKDLNTI